MKTKKSYAVVPTEVNYKLNDLQVERASNLMLLNTGNGGGLLKYRSWQHSKILELMTEGYALMCEIKPLQIS